MKTFRSTFLAATLLVFVIAMGSTRLTGAEKSGGGENTAGVEKTLHAVIKALVADDYAAFLVPGTRELPEKISEERFALIRENAAADLKDGYTVAFDVQVPEADGSVSYHWVIQSRKSGNEFHAILVIKGEKVSDLSLQ
jgi:hypothetical protein